MRLLCLTLLLSLILVSGCERADRPVGFDSGEQAATEESFDQQTLTEFAELLGSLNGIVFTYSSKNGSWSTSFTMAEDGKFSGNYKNKDSNIKGEGYSKGTVYTSDFSGKFSVIGKESDSVYKLRLSELSFDSEPGVETIKKKTRYITTNAYGLEEGDELTLYMPGTKSSSVSAEFEELISSSSSFYGKLPSELNFCGLFNSTSVSAFCSENFLVDTGSHSFEAYRNILSYYKNDIGRYNWKYSAHTRPIALSDIDGDGTKELLFFTSQTDEGPGILHVYTYSDGRARELGYPFDDINDGSDSSLMFTDMNTQSGTSYVIFRDKEENSLWIYRRHGDKDVNYWIYEYKIEDGALTEAYTLKKSPDQSSEGEDISSLPLIIRQFTENYNGEDDDGDEGGEDVSYNEGNEDYDPDDSYDPNEGNDYSEESSSASSGTENTGSGEESSKSESESSESKEESSSTEADDDDDEEYYDYYDYNDYNTPVITSSGLTGYDGVFTENDQEVSRQNGAAAFENAFERIGDVLLASSETSDVSIWQKFDKTDMICMSYEEMIEYLTD